MTGLHIEWTVRPIPWEQFKQELLTRYAPDYKRPATRRKIEQVLRLLDALGMQSTVELTVPCVDRFVTSVRAGRSQYTLKSLLSGLRTITNYAARTGYCHRPPFDLAPLRTWVKPPRPTGRRHLSRQEIAAILDRMRRDVSSRVGWAQYRARQILAITELIALTGLRRNECLYLYVQDLDLDKRIVNVVDREAHHLKTDSSAAPVALPAAAVPTLRDWLCHRLDCPPGFDRPASSYLFPNVRRSTPWVGGKPGYRPLCKLKAAARRAGVEGPVTFQCLRRSLATHLEFFGVGPALIQRQLRHQPGSDVTERFYRQPDLTNMAAAMRDFTY